MAAVPPSTAYSLNDPVGRGLPHIAHWRNSCTICSLCTSMRSGTGQLSPIIESTSSWTNRSGSNPNRFTVHGTIFSRKRAPGASRCARSQPSRRSAIPWAFGMPPTPAGRSSTRLLSVMANWPSRKNASRGSVAIQLGLPRPALRYAIDAAFDVLSAALIRKSLISNGLRLSYSFRVRTSIDLFLLAQQNDENHAPDREQRVADRIGDGVAERGHLALGSVADQTERGSRRARAGQDAEQQRIVEPEDVLADVHPEDQRHRGGERAPQEETDALCLQPVDEARAGGDADHGDEDVETDGVHEPDGRGWNASEERARRAQPAEEDARDEGPACGGQRQRYPGHFPDQRAEKRADGDGTADEGDVGDVGRPIRHPQVFRSRGSVLGAADQREDVAAVDRGIRENGNRGRGCAARDLSQEHATSGWTLGQLGEGLAVDGLVGDVDVDTLDGHVQQLWIVDLLRASSGESHDDIAGAGEGHHVALPKHGISGRLLRLAVPAKAQDEYARVRHQGLGLSGAEPVHSRVRLHDEGAQHPAMPRRAGAAHFLG